MHKQEIKENDFYTKKIIELRKRKNRYIITLICTTFLTLSTVFISLQTMEKRSISTLNEFKSKITLTDKFNDENMRFIIQETINKDKTVINELIVVISILISFIGAALINAYMGVNKQIDEIEEKQFLNRLSRY